MKTLKLQLFSLATVLSVMGTGMGFPTKLADGGKTEAKKISSTCQKTVITAPKVTKGDPTFVAMAEEDPEQGMDLPTLKSLATNTITLKVFDVKGQVVLEKEVNMDEMLGKRKEAQLPKGSTFIMFHNNIAYYFLDADLAN